ncbi:MAG: hypothetical protein ACXWID_07515 [Pyrinomonadaceae bacterium]
MKLPPFTLVYRGRTRPDERAAKLTGSAQLSGGAAEIFRERLNVVKRTAPKLATAVASLNPNLSSTLLRSSFIQTSAVPLADALSLNLKPAVKDLSREKKVITIAIWDLGARIGRLPQLIYQMNEVQSSFTFFSLQAAIPAGPLTRSTNAADWVRQYKGRLSKTARNEIASNVFAGSFFKQAQPVRKQLGVDYLVGVTPSLVAVEEDDMLYWNYFSTSSGRLMLASSYDLRRYARAAERSFEVAIAIVVLGQFIAALNPRIEFHEDRGCLFDFNGDRDSIVEVIRTPHIEPGCLKRIKEKYRATAAALMELLRNYSPEEELDESSQKQTASIVDDKYWLDKLAELSQESEEEIP